MYVSLLKFPRSSGSCPNKALLLNSLLVRKATKSNRRRRLVNFPRKAGTVVANLLLWRMSLENWANIIWRNKFKRPERFPRDSGRGGSMFLTRLKMRWKKCVNSVCNLFKSPIEFGRRQWREIGSSMLMMRKNHTALGKDDTLFTRRHSPWARVRRTVDGWTRVGVAQIG